MGLLNCEIEKKTDNYSLSAPLGPDDPLHQENDKFWQNVK